jgi:hypothetical protein
MDSIKTVLVNYAICALLGSVLEFISPKKSREAFRIVSGIILISVIVIPLVGFNFSAELEKREFEFEEEGSGEDVLLTTAGLMEKEIYKQIENILINEQIDEYEIYISTEIDEEANEIILSEANILVGVQFQNKITELSSILGKEFGDILQIGVKENGKG